VTFAGSPDRIEARLVPEAGFEFDSFKIAGLPREPGVRLVRALMAAMRAPGACGEIIERRQPDVVLGGGGYVGGPMIVAAARRHVPAALMEADAHFGLANRLAAPFARRIFLSFPIEGRAGAKYRVTGRPIPSRSRPMPRDEARRRFDLPTQGSVLLIWGGSQGSLALNELAVGEFGAAGPSVLHLSGERDYAALAPRVERPDYRLVAFTNDVGAALSAADLVLARAGASLWEIAAAGRPAVLVPYPSATGDHQQKNAAFFDRAGGAVVVPENELERVPACVEELLGDESRLARMSAAMHRVARPRAADEIADELMALAD
jgi:UDP-N-acetylglucosamine--N-acetylmuramyl-(pentapeptide) pyrophosphoryl-undecaprenol N-acetylglucosamine transferase